MINDHWPSEKYELAPPNYLVALGQATFVYNMLVSIMSQLFVRVAPLESEYALRLFHSLNNRERVDLFSGFVHKNEKDQIVADALLYCILCYNICTENRNILMHSTYFEINDGETRLVKRASNDPKREIHFDIPLLELRNVADQIADIFIYAREIYGVIFHRDRLAQISPGIPESSALPEKPPKPRILTPYQPEAIRRGGMLPHQPSGA